MKVNRSFWKSCASYLPVSASMGLDRIMGKRVMILCLEELSFIPFVLPIVRCLRRKTKKISYYMATSYLGDRRLAPFRVPRTRQFEVPLSKYLSLTHIFLSPSIFAEGPRNSIRLHISHNQPVKFLALPKENFMDFDAHFLVGPLHRQQTEETMRMYKVPKRTVQLYNIGYPKSDALLNGQYEREKVLSTLKLDKKLKTVIYAPSWEEGLSLRSFGVEIIKQILTVPDINLIVKLHPMSYADKSNSQYEMFTGGIDWREELSAFSAYSNFRNIVSDNIDPYLAASDVLITDISGVALEYLLLDRPVIYIDCPEYFRTAFKKLYDFNGKGNASRILNDPRANAGRHTGLVVKRVSDLPNAVIRSIMKPDENSNKRRKFAKLLRYNPGCASETAADKILDLLGLDHES